MMLLAGGRVVTPSGVLDPGWIRIDADRISAVGSGTPNSPQPDETRVDLGGHLVVAGFVDVHVHGGGGASYTSGDPEQTATAVAFHRRHGTARTLASLVTAPTKDLIDAVAALADLVDDGLVAGVHLEGPFLSSKRCGAQDPRYLLDPDPRLLEALLEAGRGSVRMMTVAPELPGGIELVREVVKAGALAAIGHSDASYDEANAAIDAGARVATHLFNGMRPLHHRDPGIVGAVLDRPEIVAELIADGHHLHESSLRLAGRSARGGVALVTDAISAAGAPDGEYRLGPATVSVRGGEAFLEGTRTLAGSTLTTARGLRNAVSAGLTIGEASRAASFTPASLLGIEADYGSIEVGKRADLVVLGAELELRRVLLSGAFVDEP
jgi:N-acetylglucosamine-6-phosphate deacetylase